MGRAFKYLSVLLALALTTGFVSAIDLHVFVAGDTIKAAEVNANFANLADALEGEKTLAFPAQGLGTDPANPVISAQALGLRWQAGFTESANLLIPRPDSWDGTTDVVLDVYFFPMSAAAGAVEFFIRPRAYDVGDAVSDAPSQGGTSVPVSGMFVVAKQSFSIPASSLSDGELWHISIQRGGGGETYADDVVVVTVAVRYNASY